MAVAWYLVTDGEEAIRYLSGEGKYEDREQFPIPAAVLLDLSLPGKSGFEVLEWLESQLSLRGIPVIVLTAADDHEAIQKAFSLGATRYLFKPVNEDLLKEALEDVLGAFQQPLRILLVDDDPESLPLVERCVKREFPQVTVHQVRTKQEWQQAITQKDFDAVVTDYLLPWGNGIQVARQVREMCPDCPVIMLTASGDEEVAVAALKAGLDDYVIKNPRHIVRLPTALRIALRAVQQRKTLQALEQRFQRFFQSAPVGLAMIDQTGRIVKANDALASLLGYTHDEELQGKFVGEYLADPNVADQVELELAQQETVLLETVLHRKDRSLCWAQVAIRANYDERGNLLGYDLSVTDITERRRAEELVQQHQRLLEQVLQWGQEITRTTNLQDCLRVIYRIVKEEVGLDRVAVFLYDPIRNTVSEAIGTDREGNPLEAVQNEFSLERSTIFVEAAHSPRGWVYADDYTSAYAIPPDHSMFGVRNHAVFALRAGEQLVGFLCVDNLTSQRPITQRQLEALQLLSGYAGVAIRNAQLIEVQGKRNELLEKVYQVGREVSRVTGLHSCVLQIRKAIIHEFGMDRAAVWLYDPSKDMFQGTFGTGRNGELTDEWDQVIRGDRSIRKALQQPSGFVHTLDYGATYSPVPPIMEGVKEHLSVSMWAGDKPVGVITADMLLTQRHITAEQVEAIRLFASYAGVAIENARLMEALQRQMTQWWTLTHLMHLASQRLDVESIAHAVLPELEAVFPNTALLIFLGRENNQVNLCAANEEGLAITTRCGLSLGAPLPREALSLINLALQGKEVDEGGDLVPAFCENLIAREFSWLISEAVWRDEWLGAIVACRKSPQTFTEEEKELLHTVTNHLSVALHNAYLFERLRQTLDELRQAQTALVQQERLRALGQMDSGVAHDINNALVPILTFAELLEGVQDETLREVTRYVKRAVDDIVHTVQRLRAFYRPRSPSEEFQAVNLNEVVRQVIQMTRPRWYDIPQKEGITVTMTCDLEASLPPIWGNESELREAFINLLFNAVDAVVAKHQREGTITVRTRHYEDWCVLEVEDSGIGMDEETRQRCFEPFFTTKGEAGSGLGLAMVYGIVQRHEGRIDVESEPGEGSLFRLWFPAQKTTSPTAYSPEERVVMVPSLRVLVIDDDSRVLEALRAMLEHMGHQPVLVSDGKQGVETFWQALVQGQPFDLVITDLGMPKISGAEVAKRVKAMSAETPVIVITGWGAEQRPVEADLAIGKPVRLNTLREAIAKVWREKVIKRQEGK